MSASWWDRHAGRHVMRIGDLTCRCRPPTSTRQIYLRLQGACGSCPSSTVTMKM